MKFRFLIPFLLVAITACAPSPNAATVPSAPPNAPSVASLQIAPEKCATKNAAPLDQFRSDPPSKLVSNKPRLVEFFAFW